MGNLIIFLLPEATATCGSVTQLLENAKSFKLKLHTRFYKRAVHCAFRFRELIVGN